MRTATTYACTLKGVAMMALENWDYNRSLRGADNSPDTDIYIGRMGAYASILRHITDSSDPGVWRELIDAMS